MQMIEWLQNEIGPVEKHTSQDLQPLVTRKGHRGSLCRDLWNRFISITIAWVATMG